MPETKPLTQLDREILQHYRTFFGQVHKLYTYQDLGPNRDGGLHVAEFPAGTPQSDWRYLTIGMSRWVMPTAPQPQHRIELLMYSCEHRPELADVLSNLATYPFNNQTHLGIGHTIVGNPEEGVVPGSPLTEILLTPVYFEPYGFSAWQISEETHIEVLWVTPIYPSEREYILRKGWRALVEGPFIEQEVQISDLFRDPVV